MANEYSRTYGGKDKIAQEGINKFQDNHAKKNMHDGMFNQDTFR